MIVHISIPVSYEQIKTGIEVDNKHYFISLTKSKSSQPQVLRESNFFSELSFVH